MVPPGWKASRAVAALPSLFGLAPKQRRGRGHDPMLSPIRPTDAQLRDLLARSRGLPLSYPDVGATSGAPPAGYVRDHHRVRLGEGPRDFDRACAAFRGWAMFDLGWIGAWPPNAPIVEGAVVAVVAHGFGVWAAFTCRVIRVWEDRGPVESLGFTYGTLPGHLLAGEERFEVGWDRWDGSVWFDILADSRPAGLPGHAAYPLIRRVQRRFAPASLRAMVRATGAGE
jgi:uncharacterized protein (UPF0548 family)